MFFEHAYIASLDRFSRPRCDGLSRIRSRQLCELHVCRGFARGSRSGDQDLIHLESESSPNHRLGDLDALRGLAAAYVMVGHFFTNCKTLYPGVESDSLTLPVSSQFAVHLFFIVSGFVIFMTLSRIRSVTDFAVNRAARLFPAYICAVVFTSVISLMFAAYDDRAPITLWQFLANLTMVHPYLGNIPSIDGPYWTLMVELSFYLWMGLLFARGLLPRIELVAWCWLAVCLAAYAVQSANNAEWSEPVQAAGLFKWAPLFFSGCMFYRIKQGQATWKTHLLILACSLTYAIVVVTGLVLGKRHAVAIIAIYAIFYLVVFNKLKWLAIKPLVFLGTISYSLYIFHARVGGILLTVLRRDFDVALPFALSITCAAALLAAMGITFLIERPANRVIRAWWKSRNAATARVELQATRVAE